MRCKRRTGLVPLTLRMGDIRFAVQVRIHARERCGLALQAHATGRRVQDSAARPDGESE